MAKHFCVYIMTNKHHTVLYTGVTDSLARRVYEHRARIDPRSFTSRYNIDKLVYVEVFEYVTDAVAREKQIKKGPRKKKIELIESMNPTWEDLSSRILEI